MSAIVESITAELQYDDKVKLAGIDADGMLRGKIISKKKFLSVLESGFGFCSVVFGWDMHDRTYFQELSVSNAENGYRDILAKIDLSSFRRIPWEEDRNTKQGIPFFLVSFFDPLTEEPIAPCPRGLLATMAKRLQVPGWTALAGAEYEFYNFRETPKSLGANKGQDLEHITPGMFGYSVTRPVQNQEFYYGVFDACKKFNVDLEGWHTESGPGVYEAALEYGPITGMADCASLFKYVVKALGSNHGITPCFMAKPVEGLPGNSGHMHISLADANTGANIFARGEKNPSPSFADLAYVSDVGEYFLAGILDGLPSIMPILAPTINSYKRLVENFWAPVTVSWGLEHRAASIRLISPPTASPKATRFEIRTCGADANPHYVLAAILGCGLRGVEKQLKLTVPPLGKGEETGDGERLAKNLGDAVSKMVEKGSVAREVFGDAFVDHFAGTRMHEIRLWEQAVTDWEVKRYIETV
ncbi:glutamine synthetase/guanido kinase [Wilcoxina mikolae CBS 423.85]|nr:glutamine synthetase/guanido kinase [Wilcoxina mikolae CBS 423.85]